MTKLIYEVCGFDSGGPTVYFEPTKAKALARKREMLEEDKTAIHKFGEIEITELRIAPTREGIAAALNQLISQYCVNEH